MGVLGLLFGFNGRINRIQFWLGNLGAGAGIILLTLVLLVMGGPADAGGSPEERLVQFAASFALALIPALLIGSWCGMALHWKRFHDRGKSGVWVFLPTLPSFMMVSSVFGAVATGASPAAIADAAQPWSTILLLVQLWFLVELGFLPGKEGPNRYGDAPGGGHTVTKPSGSSATSTVIPGAKTVLAGAESAMERAIAERAKFQPTSAPAPSLGPRPATQNSFGRKVAR